MSEDYELSEAELQPYPPWKEALRLFLERGWSAGDVVPLAWMYESLGLEQPTEATPNGVATRIRYVWMEQFGALRQVLLTEHKIDLASKPGVGYEVIPSPEQSARAWEDGQQEVKAALRKMRNRIVNVDLSRLTSGERQEYANDMARAAAMASAIKDARKGLSFHDGE